MKSYDDLGLNDLKKKLALDTDEIDIDRLIPKLSKDINILEKIQNIVGSLHYKHKFIIGDSRNLKFIPNESVHLVVTSPPYWTLKKYNSLDGQLGHISDYETFLSEIDKVWQECFRVLVKGGRLIVVVGDVCLSRRRNGRHLVMPLHASIQEHCRAIGFDNLTPIFWHKISNITFEVENGSSFLGKPYEPNQIIKNDIEFILMQRKPGGYRQPSISARLLSIISESEHRKWFKPIWHDLPGASTRTHPAPFPEELAMRLIRMFSFVGDTILDPFAGSGTTAIAAAKYGRRSINIELDFNYSQNAITRIESQGIEVECIPDIPTIQNQLPLTKSL